MADRGVVPSSVIRSSNTLLALQQLFRGATYTQPATDEPGARRFFRTRLYDPKKSRVTKSEFYQNLATVEQLANTQGAQVYFLFPGLYNEYGKRRLRKSANVDHPREIDMCATLKAAVGEAYEPLFVPYDEAHLSRAGHRLIADAIWERLQRDGALRR